MHKDGIDFALQDWDPTSNKAPKNVVFLDIMTEFSSKLMRQDRTVVMNYLKTKVEAFQNVWNMQDQQFVPLMTYKNSLMQGVDDGTGRRGKNRMTREEEEELSMPPTPFRQNNEDASNLLEWSKIENPILIILKLHFFLIFFHLTTFN